MSTPDYSKKQFLVVDDFDNARRSVKKMLTEMGAEHISLAGSGKEAIQYCKQIVFDVLLLDYNLGDGKNGQQLLEQLRIQKLLPHKCIVIMCTAEIEQEMVLCAAEHQPDSYLAKPFTFMLLQSRLKKLNARAIALQHLFSAQDSDDTETVIRCCDEQIDNSSRYAKWCKKTKAEMLLKQQDLLAAEQIYREELEQKTSDWALLGLGDIFFANEQSDKALKQYQQAIEFNRMNLTAYDKAAEVLERQGEFVKAQKFLEQASNLSSRSIVRMSHLAELAEENGDKEVALKCFKQVYKLAPNSIHHSAKQGLKLARCISDVSVEQDPSDAKKSATEALRILKEVGKEFDEPEVELNSALIESCAYHTLDDKQLAEQSLDKAKQLIEHSQDDASVDLEMAKSLVHLGKNEEAQALLTGLYQNNKENTSLRRQIDRVAEKPISEAGEETVRQLSKSAMQAYTAQKFDEAIEIYDNLAKQYPRHLGVRLNLVQAYLGGLSRQHDNADYLSGCEICLNSMKHLQPIHPKFERYNLMQRKFDALNRQASRHGH